MPIQSINPATDELMKTFDEEKWSSVQEKLVKAQQAFYAWRSLEMKKRTELIQKVADILRDGKEEYARLMTLEMGKSIAQARSEVEKCAWACEYAAQMGQEWLNPEVVQIETTKSYIRFDPLGVILAIMPWNFPFWQFFRFAAGALVAGNTVVLKHASNVPKCALAIAEIFRKAGVPDGIVQVVLISGSAVEPIISDPRIAAVTLTGSTSAGKRVAAAAGQHVKKCVLELGGSDAFIVLNGADVQRAAAVAVQARTLNAGQSCIAAKRFIVVKEVAAEFTRQFVEKMKTLIVGDPMDERTQVGPLARRDLVDELNRQVRQSVASGAMVLCGGKMREGKGNFYEPTVLGDVSKGMPAYDEELFGPVATIVVAKNADDAVRIANDTIYGLGAAIWTDDIPKAEIFAQQLECGAVFINDFVKSDPRLPFGGIKQSGYGRELGIYGIHEFVNIKTVVIK